MDTKKSPSERWRLSVTGVVQGVGFRPFIYGLALQWNLGGYVLNHSGGVTIEVEGLVPNLTAFHSALNQAALDQGGPPLARIETVVLDKRPLRDEISFVIAHSQDHAEASTLISPDVCICQDCLAELFDPKDRRYRYPFINCTNCGPRFTIIRDIPYDRPLTTMANFPMCPACQAEYKDPLNRRFHAQPNACPVCGPEVVFHWSDFEGEQAKERFQKSLRFLKSEGSKTQTAESDPIQKAQALILAGGIVAVKGLGGFHLACNAADDEAVQRLRARKGRVDKPFALMVRDLADVREIAHLSPAEASRLTSQERPIVLLRKKKKSSAILSNQVAPGNPYIGVMLPYTPLHYLLLTPASPDETGTEAAPFYFVMTSGNYSDEPIVKDDQTALEALTPLADAFLSHNRAIHARSDDSVIRVFRGQDYPIRRSRGYAPFPVKLPFSLPPILAVGGELKSTFCLVREQYAFLSQHIGDMENLETLTAFDQATDHFQTIFRVQPEVIVSDLHPDYLSSRWALETKESKKSGQIVHIQVQHHHAHIASVMAEHGINAGEKVLGFSFDGAGYGPDRAIWGGEVLLADYQDFKRIAHLAYIPLPGGDAAVKRPYRIALAHLWAAGIAWTADLPPVQACPLQEQKILQRQFERQFNTIPTSSMGRLFDAVAALIGLRQTITYEAQAAIELEALAGQIEQIEQNDQQPSTLEDNAQFHHPYHLDWSPGDSHFTAAPLIRAIVADLRAGIEPAIIAYKFHQAIAGLILSISQYYRETAGINQIALSGGVFQNLTLLDHTLRNLEATDFAVLIHQQVPPNDGGLALGQAMVAGHRLIR